MTSVVITGASSGIGAAAARRFARSGARVYLVARGMEKLAEIASEIGTQAVALPCDAADWAAVETMASRVLQDGAPDVVINCAGAGTWKTLEETSTGEARQMMDAPYFAAFNTTKAFLPAMKERGRGVLIHVNSPACRVTWPSSVGYAAARHALEGFHKAVSQDLHGTGVRSCHAIFGAVSSAYWANNPGARDRMPGLSRYIRTMTPDQAADALFRLSRAPRNALIHPQGLRLALSVGAAFPPLARWLARL